jgi:hypothetical protein
MSVCVPYKHQKMTNVIYIYTCPITNESLYIYAEPLIRAIDHDNQLWNT